MIREAGKQNMVGFEVIHIIDFQLTIATFRGGTG